MGRKRIAVLVASIDREYQQDFARGLMSAGEQYNVDICIFNSQGHMNEAISTSETGESMIYDLPDLSQFDGIISMLATLGNEYAYKKVLELLKPLKGKPHVSVDVPIDGAVMLSFNDRVSVQNMTEHLINEHGVRRMAFVSGPLNHSVALERLNACKETLKRHGLSLDDNLIFDGEWTRVGGRRAAEHILEMGGELPDAIMCANDDMALSVIEYFKEQGIRVPRDIAVTGFDALREAVMRGLTTICRPIDKSARKAVEILYQWMNGEVPELYECILPTTPIYSESCGCIQSLEYMNEKLRGLSTDRRNMETILTRVSMFSSAMAGVGDEKEAGERIREFADSWNIRELFLCVNPTICRDLPGKAMPEDTSSYPEEMLLLYGAKDGKQYPCELFQTRDLVPLLEDMRKNPVCLVFCPLYYRNSSLGYVAMNLVEGTGSALYSVLMLLNGAMMSLYLQTNIKRYAETIANMAIHDIMTGMLNRRGFMEQAPAMLEDARKRGKVFVMISADMDHMKMINDQYGHLVGDEAICRMGRGMNILRESGYIPVHISGDEFLAYGIAESMEEAKSLIGSINQELDKINKNEPWISEISASFGLYAAVPGEWDEIDDFLTKADRAMYEEKNRKKSARAHS